MKSVLLVPTMMALMCAAPTTLALAQQAKPAASAPAAPKPQAPPVTSDTRVVETTNYNAWSVTCDGVKAGAANWRCNASFTMKDQKTGAVLLVWFLSPGKDGKFVAEIVTPTGMQVDKGVDVSFGAPAKTKKIGYTWCDANQCSAQSVLEDAVLKDLVASANTDVTLTTVLKDGRALNFKFPLAGIDKVVARLKG